MSSDKLPVMEIFGPTIQGEGPLAGQRSHFIRLGGCGYRCTWCDSMHSVDPEQVKAGRRMMTTSELCEELMACGNVEFLAGGDQSHCWVTISGGDPVMHDLEDLVSILEDYGWSVAIETQGQFYKPYLIQCDQVTVSPKPPSSGMDDKYDFAVIQQLLHMPTDTSFKFVIFTEEDYKWVKERIKELPNSVGNLNNIYLSVGTEHNHQVPTDDEVKHFILKRMEWLYDRVSKDPFWYGHDVVVLPQLHVLAWGTKLGV